MSSATTKVLSGKELKNVDKPIVALFEEGKPTTDMTFQSYVKQSKEGEQRIVFGETEHMRFEAGNELALGELETSRPAYKKRKLVQYAVGIYDEKSKTVEICPLDQIYEVHQRSKKRLRETDEDEKDVNAKRKAYLTNFGASSFKKTVAQYQKYGMDIITKHVAVTGKDFAQARQKTTFSNFVHLLPPFNIDAKKPENVYPINQIVVGKAKSLDFSKSLEKLMSEKRMKDVEKLFPQTVVDIVESQRNKDASWLKKKENKNAVQYLTYMFGLLRYPERFVTNQISQDNQKFSKVPKEWHPSEKILTNMCHHFGSEERGKVTRSSEHISKLICYTIALALNLGNFRIKASSFSADTGKSEKDVAPYFKALGCRNDKFGLEDLKSQASAVYVLKTPLKGTFVTEIKERVKKAENEE